MGSIKEAFGIQIKRKEAEFAAFSPSRFERKEMELKKEDQQLLGMVLEIKKIVFEDPNLKKSVKVSTEDQGVVMRYPANLFFSPGQAAVKKGSVAYLKSAIKILKERNVNLVVRGHSNDRMPQSTVYPTNWELTSARAAALLRGIMQEGEIPATRLKAVGYADSQPLLPNNSTTNRATNNRIELYFHQPESKSW